MRSRTEDHLPGRCPRCWVRVEHCVCADIPALTPKTKVLFVRHEREARKSTGTARIAHLALTNSEVVEAGEEAPRTNALLEPLVAGAVLLFPSEQPAPWPTGPVERLIVLDGTWRQTRRMFHKLPALHGLPQLTLPTKAARVLRLRESTFAEGRSTLEAAADALALLGDPELSAALYRLHDLYVERVFRARGVWEQKSKALISG